MTRLLVCAVLAAVLLGPAACEEANDLGKYCFVGASTDPDAGFLLGDSWHNPECLSGLCLKQGGYGCDDGSATCPEPETQVKIQPMCTHACESSGDCVGSSDNVNDCRAYVCQRSDPSQGGPPVPCHCVCLDYLRDGDGVTLTPTAFDTSDLACTP